MTRITCFGRLAPLLIAFCLAPVAGCGKSAPAPKQHIDLDNIYEIYQHYIKSHEGTAPAKLADIAAAQYEGIHPVTVKYLKDGNYVVVWNVTGKDASTVLAYEKKAAIEGGAVLMANGSVRNMTADEIKSSKR